MKLILPEPSLVSTEMFVQELQNVCGHFQVTNAPNAKDMLGLIALRQTAGLSIANIGLNAVRVTRNAGDLRRDPGDHFFLILQQTGSAEIIQNDNSHRLDPGDMMIVDSSQPSVFRFNGYSAQVSVHLAREEMIQRFGRRITGGIVINKDDLLGQAMRCILTKLVMDEKVADPHIGEVFYATLGALLTERCLHARKINPDRLIVTRALTLINEHFRESDFSTRGLADLMNISLRRLQRAFKIVDETPRDRLQSVRIEHAHQAIVNASADSANPSISTIAYASGFNDLSTFYRYFRNRYHSSPKEHIGNIKRVNA